MTINSDDSNVSRRSFLVGAGTVAAASSFAVAGVPVEGKAAPAATPTYTLTIDVTKNPIAYGAVDNHGNSTNGYKLRVFPGDSVSFKAVSSGKNRHFAAIVFLADTPFTDSVTGRPVNALIWSEGDEANPSVLNVDADALGNYEYRVVVFDKESGAGYTEDPKIIVGTGGLVISKVLKELDEIAEANPKEKEKIKSIESNLQRLTTK
jgi:hypothetical protein